MSARLNATFRGTQTRAHKGVTKAVTVLLFLLLASLFLGAQGGGGDPWSIAMRLEFDTPIAEFVSAAQSVQRDARLDWSSDGCSAPVIGSTGRSFDFTDACRRHDFAYRNLGRLDAGRKWTAALRARVDSKFLSDMRVHCDARQRRDKAACRAWANLFYSAVRQFSGP